MSGPCLDLFSECATLVELLRLRTSCQPEKTAYTFLLDGEVEEQDLTYADLDRRARVIGAQLQGMGAAGERVLLLYPPGLEYTTAFFGCLYAGAVAVPSYPPRLNKPDPRLTAIVNDAQAKLVLTDTHIFSGMERRFEHTPELGSLHWLASDELVDELASDWQAPSIDGDTLAFLQYTSGSTATPKGVMVSHGNLMHNLRAIQQCFETTEHSRGVFWLPFYHDMGLIGGLLEPVYCGGTSLLMSPIDFLQRPLRWLQAISRTQATISGGPNFAYDLCVRKIAPEAREGLDLSSWGVAFNGAEPVRHETMARFTEAFGPCGFRPEALLSCYGLAEGTLIVSGGSKAAPPVVQAYDGAAMGQNRVVPAEVQSECGLTLVGCGNALSAHRIAIADVESGESCPPGRVGEIWVSGPSVAQGYWNRPEETARTFDACLLDTCEGPFLRTGDLGFLHDGELFVTGRIKDLIIIRGRNHYPQDIELTVEGCHEALEPGAGAAFSVDQDGEERLVIVQELKRTHRKADVDDVAAAIRQAVMEEHGLQVHDVVLVKPMRIPKTSSGKIQRNLCRTRYLEGSLKVLGSSGLAAPSASSESGGPAVENGFIHKALLALDDPAARHSLLTVYLQEQAARVLRIASSQVNVERSLGALGLDSLKAVELAHEIESGLGVALPVADLLQGPTISGVARHVLEVWEQPATSPPVITPSEVKPGLYSLSRGQRALWLLHRLDPRGAAYTMAAAARLRLDLDVQVLERALEALIERHTILRTIFPAAHGEPQQRVHARTDVQLDVEDVSTWDEERLNDRLAEEMHRPFDLEQGPLMRVHLFSRSNRDHVCLLVMHHIVGDFWSLAVLADELWQTYSAIREGRLAPQSAPLQYVDYARWEAEMLAGAEGERLWAYWQDQLSGELPVLNLPTDRPRPAIQTYRGGVESCRIGRDLAAQLGDLGRANGATLYVTLLAAFQTLLHRYTGQEDIIVGSPTAGRERAALAGVVGYLVNPVPLRGDLSGNPSFETLLQRVQQTVVEALAHRDFPFDLLVERLRPERDPSRSPVFQTLFTLQQSPLPDEPGLASLATGEPGVQIVLGGVTQESVALEKRAVQFELAMTVAELADGLCVNLEYNSDLFDVDTVRRMLRHFQTLLSGIVSHPEQNLSALPMLIEADRRRVLAEWNATQVEYSREATVHHLFEVQAKQRPDKVAVVSGARELTYDDLNRQANQLAHHLQSLGVGPGIPVGICMERSPEMAVGLLGILKAGGYYVPLDPAFPRQRLAYMVGDAAGAAPDGALVLLTQRLLFEEGALSAHDGPVVCVDDDRDVVSLLPDADPGWPVGAEDLAYTIYTSGSTGWPKGVQVRHRAVVNFLNAMQAEPGFTCEDVLLAVTTLSFDIAGLELFLPLATGGRIVLAGHEDVVDGGRLAALLEDSGATVMQATPATWQLLLEAGWQGGEGFKVLCGGEAFPRGLANQLVERASEVWNMYGPTETTIWSSICRVHAGEDGIPIGRPIDNTQMYVLDSHLQPVPVGVWGELYIGGDGLARGYLNRPALTAAKFIPDPFGKEAGARLYRVGDVVRFLPDGQIAFLGRTDFQVKIRGYRIEIGEIESVLGQHEHVKETVVVAREDTPGDKRLVAYIVPAGQPAPTVSELRGFLGQKLPDYMVPSAFVMLEALPLTPNGKIDRRALPAPQGDRPELETAYVRPQTQFERVIADAWREALQVDQVGVHDNFFDLGGHSLLMARVHSQLQDQGIGEDISIVELFQYPTVHMLAKRLGDGNGGHALVEVGHARAEVRAGRQSALERQRERRRRVRAMEQEVA